MRKSIMLLALVALAGCENNVVPEEAAEIDAQLTMVGQPTAVNYAVRAQSPRFGTDNFETYNRAINDLQFPVVINGEIMRSASPDLVDRVNSTSIFEKNGVTLYHVTRGPSMVDGVGSPDKIIRLTDGVSTRDVGVLDKENTNFTSDGRLMVRLVGTLDWTVYSVDGSGDDAFTQPENILIFDMMGDQILAGHKHDGVRVLHTLTR